MNLRLSEEERLIKETVSRFVKAEVLPLEFPLLKQKEPFLPPGDPPTRELAPELRKLLVEKAKASGIWSINLPDDSGEARLSQVGRMIIYRELGATVVPFEPLDIPWVLEKCSIYRKITSGEVTLALVMGEVHNTGDLSAIRSSFERRDQYYRLRASELSFIGECQDFFLIPARDSRSGEIGIFIVNSDLPGVIVKSAKALTAERQAISLELDDCELAADALVGGEEYLLELIAVEQLKLAARSLGIGSRCMKDTLEHARNRVTFGAPLSSRQAVQWMLADLSVRLRAATWLTFEAAWRMDSGLPYIEAARVAKRLSVKMAFDAADIAIQIHGGYGVCKEFPFEAFYRESRLMRLLYGREREIDRLTTNAVMTSEF
jgi:alkylation response protein AidB-like acyl-CoA dehydrogenase